VKTNTSTSCHELDTVNGLLALRHYASLLFPSVCAKNW